MSLHGLEWTVQGEKLIVKFSNSAKNIVKKQHFSKLLTVDALFCSTTHFRFLSPSSKDFDSSNFSCTGEFNAWSNTNGLMDITAEQSETRFAN